MARTWVYIDGFNLYYGCLKRTPYKWLNVAALAQALLPNDSVETIKYFTARVSARPQNPSALIDQQVYLRALRTIPNLEIVFGHFLTHSVPMMLTGVMPPQRVWVDKTEEKGSDVNLAAHLVRDAFQKRFELAVLITNDSDLAEPVRDRHERTRYASRHFEPARAPQRYAETARDVCKTDPPVTPYRQPVPAGDGRQERRVFEARVLVKYACGRRTGLLPQNYPVKRRFGVRP